MKYLKYFESNSSIDVICYKYDIKNYTVNPDGTVDVDGDVNLYVKGLTKLPLKFGYVSGGFDCGNNGLTSLEGAPKEVGGSFLCSNNELVTLKGAPRKVGRDFDCYYSTLPQEIFDNIRYIRKIIKYQSDYNIWRRDGTLDKYRFSDMMKEILEEEESR